MDRPITAFGVCVKLHRMNSKRSRIFWGIWCIGVGLGLYLSIQRTAQINDLKRAHREVKAKAGLLEVEDPSMVYVMPVNEPVIPLVMQTDQCRAWQFQIHLPVGYAPQVISLDGPIDEGGLRNEGGHTSSHDGFNKESIRGLWTITLHQDDGKWMVSRNGPTSSGRTELRGGLMGSLDELVVKTICPEPGQTVEINPDVFFNLVRVRTVEEASSRSRRKRKVARYAGTSMWIGPQSSQSAFDAVRQGSRAPEDVAKVMLDD